ncbi:MAG: DUF4835 family protein [Paludibacteraceae bacterium]|nr:DUF4835 family protein [Paludibacteraceae bacterium]
MRKLLLYSALLLTVLVQAQELNMTVNLNTAQVEGTNQQMFETLKQSIMDFYNSTRWTDMTVAEGERIECSMFIIVKSVTTENLFSCEMQVQSRRPIYNTNYSSPLINFKDNDFNFVYQEYDRIEFQPQQFTSNLAALLAYYAYLIIGYDMDSYARLGGTPYFQVCENIAQMGQSASTQGGEADGWKAFASTRNRYALINNLMDEAFHPFREYIYTYHRLGLDIMAENVANGRARIAKDIEVLHTANKARPATYVVYTFMDAKNDELVQLFKKGTAEEKKAVYDVCMAVDPTRQDQYDKINK